MKFEFATANRIIFGPKSVGSIGELAAPMGRCALLICGSSKRGVKQLQEHLDRQRIKGIVYSVIGEPTLETIEEGVQLVRSNNCDLIIGFGGGSVIDSGKAIAAMANNSGELLDYLEVVGKGQSLSQPSMPYIAIPTTAGTGAEVTKNAVISSKEHKVKVSLRSPLILPRVVVVDPELTCSMPPSITASTGLDALTQVLEPYVSSFANPITDAFCREGLERAGRSLRRAYDCGGDLKAREDMAVTSLLGGLALANAKLGAVHGFAGVLGGMYNIPHGMVCGALLPHVISVNVQALLNRESTNQALKRYNEIAALLTGNSNSSASHVVSWINELCRHLSLPGLGEFGLTEKDFPIVIEKAGHSSSMKGNPIELTKEEMYEILQKAL